VGSRAGRLWPAVRRLTVGEAGQTLVVFVLALTALLAAAGIAIDVGRFYSERRFLQNAADAAALAGANALTRGATSAQAYAEALAVLTRNFAASPSGVTPPLPPAQGSEIYESGHANDPDRLLDGIRIGSFSVRVAVHNDVSYTFGRIVGLTSNTIRARARARFDGDLMPIAVRRFVKAPGPSGGSYPCVDDQTKFMDFFATANTACLGTDGNASLRVTPNAGGTFNATTPDNDRANHGPIVEILGQGSDPDNGADFRGFIALDIRNFANSTSQLYYNGVTAATNAQTLRSMEATWILNGGYPGPLFPPVVSPPDPNDQVATLSGNDAGVAIDAFAQRFAPGDEIIVAVYPGITMEIPDFTMTSPGAVSLPGTGSVLNVASLKVTRNQAFSGTVSLTTVADMGDAANPMRTNTLLGGATPFIYTPNAATPSLGSGTTVTMTNGATAGAPDGIYTLWLRGEAGSPYLSVKYTPFSLHVGTVSRDFSITSSASEAIAAAAGDTVAFALALKRLGGSPFSGIVNLTLEALPGETLPVGLGAVTFSPASVTPVPGNGASSTLSINTGTVAPGQYTVVVRATGLNGDTPAHQVTHLLPLRITIGGSGSAGRKDYVDITGFAVMRVVSADSNVVRAYAITPVVSDLLDSRLRRGQAARLVPWDN
jgi:hypothetical protein